MFLSLLLLLFSSAAADEGKFTFLGEQQCAPFEGVLFDPPALASILARQSTANLVCQARIEYELSVEAASYELDIRDLQISFDALREENTLMITQKDLEIQQLQESILSQSSDNRLWWYVGGVATGMAATYGAYRLFQ
tara:strand:- start:1985 stop:2398 length:414 start_codon:yes stop_codon:yes gene_type:complete